MTAPAERRRRMALAASQDPQVQRAYAAQSRAEARRVLANSNREGRKMTEIPTEHPDYDDSGRIVPGSYAVGIVATPSGPLHPVPIVAVCDNCGNWASQVYTGSTTTSPQGDGPHFSGPVLVSRKTVSIVYACPDHGREVGSALSAEHGASTNSYDVDELATEVYRTWKMNRSR